MRTESNGSSARRGVASSMASREKPVRECAGKLFTQQKFFPENSEASLLGAAVIGMTAMEVYPSISEAGKAMVRGQAAEPSGLNATAARLYERFQEQKVIIAFGHIGNGLRFETSQ